MSSKYIYRKVRLPGGEPTWSTELERGEIADEVERPTSGTRRLKHLGWANNVADFTLTAAYQTIASFTVTTTDTNYVIWGALTFYDALGGLVNGTTRIAELTGGEQMGGDVAAFTAGTLYKFTASVSGELKAQSPGSKTFAIQAKSGTSNTRVDATDAWVTGYEYS